MNFFSIYDNFNKWNIRKQAYLPSVMWQSFVWKRELDQNSSLSNLRPWTCEIPESNGIHCPESWEVWCLLVGVGVVGSLVLTLCDIVDRPPGMVLSIVKSCSAFQDTVLELSVSCEAPSEMIEDSQWYYYTLPCSWEDQMSWHCRDVGVWHIGNTIETSEDSGTSLAMFKCH